MNKRSLGNHRHLKNTNFISHRSTITHDDFVFHVIISSFNFRERLAIPLGWTHTPHVVHAPS